MYVTNANNMQKVRTYTSMLLTDTSYMTFKPIDNKFYYSTTSILSSHSTTLNKTRVNLQINISSSYMRL